MKKFLEYFSTCSAVFGTLIIVGAVGSVETDQWLKGGVLALLGMTMLFLSIYAQEGSKDIADANEGVETYMVDANYAESDTTKYLGKVKYDTDSYNQTLEEAVEAEDIHIDTYAAEDEPHQLTKIKLVDDKITIEEAIEVGQKLKKEKEESDVDIALNLEAEQQLGK